jgi:hypothetical protein
MSDAPWYVGPLASMVTGGLSGLAVSLLGDRFRVSTNLVRTELKRLDDMRDTFEESIATINHGAAVERQTLSRLSQIRVRLGQNVSRLALSSDQHTRLEGHLLKLDDAILALEDANDQPGPGAVSPQIAENIEVMRRSLIAAAKARFLTFRLMGPG